MTAKETAAQGPAWVMRYFNPFRPPAFRAPKVAIALPIALLSGCVAVPDLGPRPALRSAGTVAAQQSLPASPDGAWPGEGWWSRFGDPQLDGLIAEALRDSPDVAAAAARLRRAAAQAQEAGAPLLPRLDAQGSAGLEKQSFNNGFPEQFTALLPQGWEDRAQISAGLGYDLDLWGRNHAALAAATSEARAAAIETGQVRLTLTTGIALAYADLARLFDARDNRQAALDLRLATARLVGAREANGLETRGSLRQAEAQVASARADLGAAEEALALRRHQIAALVGAGPDRGLAITRPSLAAPTQAGLPADVTTDLIGRRPDIAAARARAEAASRRVKVARADFFPAIRLNALIGLQSLGIGNLFESASVFGNVGPAVSLPLFHGGALSGRYRGARAGYDEAVASYDKAVIGAYQQAADAVTAQRLVGQRLADTRAALAAQEEAYAIARLRYDGGLSTYLDVLAVEDRLLQARLAASEVSSLARTADIGLIRALGGGYEPAMPAAGPSGEHPDE